jgi:hypothetical protein
MKKILLLHLILLTTLGLQGQSDSSASFRQTFGANTLYIVNIGESETPPISVLSPYLLDYSIQKGKIVARLGLGGSLSRVLTKEEGFADHEIDLKYKTDFRAGVYTVKTFDPKGRFGVSYGFDAFLSSASDVLIQDSAFDRVTTSKRILSYGGGVTFALRYEIIKNLIIHSELSMYGRYAKQRDKVSFENFPNANDVSDITIGTDIWIISPINIFVSYRF